MPQLPKFKFNPAAFGHTLIARKAERWLKAQFDAIGQENMTYIVNNNRNLLDYVPAEMKANWKIQSAEYKEMFPQFTDEEVYGWVPQYWRNFIEAIPGGKDWGMRQVSHIRSQAMG